MVDTIWFPQISEELCTGCGDCVFACPTDALALESRMDCTVEVAVVSNPAACNYCAECETICPVDAIALPYQIGETTAVSHPQSCCK